MELIQVGIADYKVANTPNKITTAGLGSCVGVCIWDKTVKTGGLLHIMLPYSKGKEGLNPAKFADSGIYLLEKILLNKGASKSRLVAKIAGGSEMFKTSSQLDIMKIGERNIYAVKEVLQAVKIPILAEDVGGNSGRTIVFDLSTGQLLVKMTGQGEKII